MNKLLPIGILLISIFHAPAQTKQPNPDNVSLELTGHIVNAEIDAGKPTDSLRSYTTLNLTVDLKLTNKGAVPIILLTDKLSFLGVEIAENTDELKKRNGKFSSYNFATSSAFVGEREWAKFSDELDKEYPPSDMTIILLPNSSLRSSDKIQINLPTENGKKYTISPWKQMTLEELKELPSVYLRFYGCDLLNYGLENKAEKSRVNFAKTLQNKWKSYGHLWLSQINSKPILLDWTSNISTAKKE